MINFPTKIRYIDTNEDKIINSLDDVEKTRAFVIEPINIEWGRKCVVLDVVDED